MQQATRQAWKRHCPEAASLHAIVREHLEPFARFADERDAAPLPRCVPRAFRAHLRFGLWEHGFWWIWNALPGGGPRQDATSVVSIVAWIGALVATVRGLEQTFSSATGADPAARQPLLSEGIARAMTATAIGLTVFAAGILVVLFAGHRRLGAAND